MTSRPLYIVDMTLYEFLAIFGFISKLDDQLSINERRVLLKREINHMLGTIPMDDGKPPRKLSSAKDKMVQNFMITINNLELLENLKDSKNLYQVYNINKEEFYQKLRKLLLYKGNLFEYVRAIEKVNQNEDINKNSQYIDSIAYELYKKFPHISKAGHRKQAVFIIKWLRDEKLGIFETIIRKGVKIYKSKLNI